MVSHRIRVFFFRNDLLESPLTNMSVDLPGSVDVSLREDVLDFFKCASGRFGEAEEDVDEGRKVERAKNEIGLVGDGR